MAWVTDMRRGFASLSGLVQSALDKRPLSGQAFIFRGRRGDLIKLIWHDGDGMCLFLKRLDRGRIVWPQATRGAVSLTRAQLSMLCEGIRSDTERDGGTKLATRHIVSPDVLAYAFSALFHRSCVSLAPK